jgi:NAD(P)-dependent dehydrogenase (short-subunit alcohol dehydrogenase family)
VADCRDDREIDGMVTAVVDRFGGLDIAVNNIGMMAGRGGGPVLTLDGAYWRDLLNQNLVLTALCARAEAHVMVEHGRGGVILNVSSGETTRPSPYLGAYGAAKAGINHLTQTMAVELGPSGIRVVAIAPRHHAHRDGAGRLRRCSGRRHHRVESVAAHDRVRRARAVGGVPASDFARCITGQLILADAGAHLSRTRPPNLGP